jgi:hypothetical protein
MNLAGNGLTPLSDAQIDRLVDGECDDAERRALLLRLEADPDGWRRCALAFLEDQAFRSALAGPVPSVPLVRPSLAPSKDRKALAAVRVAVAAGLIAATFALGFALGGGSRGRDAVDLARADAPPPARDPAEVDDVIREVGWASLKVGAGGEETVRRVPILAGPGLDEAWLRSRPSAVPEYVRAQWERDGFQLAERRQLLSLNLDDGRRLAIPVQDVEVEYVGQATY